MSGSTNHLPQITSGQGSKEVVADRIFGAMSPAALFGRDEANCLGLTLAYIGGWFPKADGSLAWIDNDEIDLTPSATNYVYSDDGVVTAVTVAPSGWPRPLGGNKIALYEAVAGADSVTSWDDLRAVAWAAGGGVAAEDVSITDVGTYYTGTDVEAALQEIGAALATLTGTTDVDTDVAYTSDTGSTADSDPGNGLFKWNNGTQGSSTALYFDNQTAPGVSLTTFFAALPPDGFIHLVQDDDATKWQLWKWSGLPTAGSGYYKFTGLTLMASGGSIADNKATSVSFKGTAPRNPSVTTVSYSATTTIDLSTIPNGGIARITLTGNITIELSNGTDGQKFVLELIQDGTGSRLVTLSGTYFRFGTDIASFTATTTASKMDRVGCIYNTAATKADVTAVVKGF